MEEEIAYGVLLQKEVESAVAWLHGRAPIFAVKIAPIYQLLNWTWSDRGVPDIGEIEKTLQSLIDDLQRDASESPWPEPPMPALPDAQGRVESGAQRTQQGLRMCTGGLEVWIDKDGFSVTAGIEFVVSERNYGL